LLLATFFLAAVLAPAAIAPTASAQAVYLAFGDSITFGVGAGGPPDGYPAELEDLLNQRGVNAQVLNEGLPGETTVDGRNRLGGLLGGIDVLLLMEGTNDINSDISPETTAFNLDAMADAAEARDVEVVHATIIPRLPSAGKDSRNVIGGQLSGAIRELAHEENRNLADPFYVFFRGLDDAFDRFYLGGEDKFHLNAEGYDQLAEVFADAITGEDEVPPVTGLVSPFDDQQNTSPNAQLQIDLYDFGNGIDVDFTQLTIDDSPANATIGGDSRRQTLRVNAPAGGWECVVIVDLQARDTAVPANARDGQLVQFVIQGTRFIQGDITRDCRVNGNDLLDLARLFGSQRGDSRYRGFADINGDDSIDGTDLAILSSNFGQSSK